MIIHNHKLRLICFFFCRFYHPGRKILTYTFLILPAPPASGDIIHHVENIIAFVKRFIKCFSFPAETPLLFVIAELRYY